MSGLYKMRTAAAGDDDDAGARLAHELEAWISRELGFELLSRHAGSSSSSHGLRWKRSLALPSLPSLLLRGVNLSVRARAIIILLSARCAFSSSR